MTYVKRRGMILLVDDSEVPKYTGEGFSVFNPAESLAAKEAGAKDAKNSK